MSQILNKVRDVDPNNSDAVKEVLSTFFQNLTKHAATDSNRWLQALENIINRFPKFCGTHRNTIETYLTNFLDSTNYFNVIEAAKCAHALQQVRPSQEKNATPKACWREHLIVLNNAVHNLLSAMFPNTVDMYQNTGNIQKLKLQTSASLPLFVALEQIHSVPTTHDNGVSKQQLLNTRLRNVFVFLQATLVEIYPVAKPIPPQAILEVIVRALSISSGAKQTQDMAKVASVKIQALRTLDALIACLGSNLIPFSALVFKFVMLTLKWSSENVNEESSQVRRGAYDTLRRWLRSLSTHRLADSSRGRSWEDELTQHVIDDITPAKHIVQLTMSNQSTKNLSKKAKRKLANSMLQESSIASHSPGEKNKVSVSEKTNDEIALSALDCAEAFFVVCGVFLKPTTHQQFQERLVRECYNLDSYSSERALGLIRVLEALRKTTPPDVPPPTQYCLQLYSGLVNRAGEISKFCSQALLDIRLHLHCAPPSLNYAARAPPAQPPPCNKKLSSRNREALEALLGADKVPSEKSVASEASQEVITISDEPSKKKPRLVDDGIEIADQICVSSDSASSVEISDDDSDVQEVEDDVEHKTPAEKCVELTESSENTADTTVAATNENTVDTNENIAVTNENTADTNGNPTDLSYYTHDIPLPAEAAIQTVEKIQETIKPRQIEGGHDETTTLTSEGTRNGDESRDTTANGSESAQRTGESTISTEGDTTDAPYSNIYTLNTQLPSKTANFYEEQNSQHSMEVAYDLSCTGKEVTRLDGPEDDNLPCTDETDDIPITCGQVVKNSQEADNKENEVPKMNGDKSPEKTAAVTDKTTGKDVTVEDMLADFVDEINDEKTEA
ncbi:uncharacterized protein LOC135077399 [Ostrinia nubilalis]|uniref:uncharacterized protein LOC135077399 n=1 Tax=Ostrinia nubilalis TaxID=29057 RepID=UPI00308263A1